MKRTIFIIPSVLLFSAAVFAQVADPAASAYCKYAIEQADAQRDLLRSPSAVVGPTEPSAGTPAQMVFGVRASLADNLKAPLTTKAAHTSCDLYVALSEAQRHINFAGPRMQRDALAHRIQLIQQASEQLDRLIQDEQKMVVARNETRPGLYHLQSARARLDLRRVSELGGFLPYVPPLSDVPLRELVATNMRAEQANQKALIKLEKQSGWDVQLSGGARRQLSDLHSGETMSTFGPYGEVSLSYNFGRHSANSHLDKASAGYLDFKASKFDEVAQESAMLKKQIEETLTFWRPQLAALQARDSEIDDALKSVEGLSTSNARGFKNQLLADQVVLRVDIGDVQFRIDWLESYLRDNF